MKSSGELIARPEFIPEFLPASASDNELTFASLGRILRRRRTIFWGTLAVILIAGAVTFATSTRLYKATAEIQVQKDTADALGLNSIMGASSESASDALDTNITIQTQAQVLQSDSLALQVIKELNLEHSPDFDSTFNPVGWALGLLSPKGDADPVSVPLEDAPGRRTHVLKAFGDHLTVKPVPGTRLIDVTYMSKDRKTAAAVANRLVQDLVEYNFQTRHTATQEAGSWLESQLAGLRKQSEDLQAKLVGLQRESGVFTLGQTDTQGKEQVYTPVLDRLQQSTAQLAQAQSARIMKGALYQVVKDGDPELISGLAGSGMLTAAPSGMSSSLSLLSNLRAQEAQKQAELDELTAKFGPGYSKVQEVRASLTGIQQAIHSEGARIASRVKNDYEISQQVENSARAEFNNERTDAEALNNKTVEYEIVQQEATQSRNLYENLLGRLKEADLVAGLRSSNITLVDEARVPAKPAKPNLLLFLAASIVGGFFLAACAALFRDSTDSRIQEISQLESIFAGLPIGSLPFYKVGSGDKKAALAKGSYSLLENGAKTSVAGSLPHAPEDLIVLSEPRAAFTEALRVLRTSLMNGMGAGVPPQVVLVTSSLPGEGKSLLSLNLAALCAQQGKNVLLVDGDLRTPVIHTRLNLDNAVGLSSILSIGAVDKTALETPVPVEGVSRLSVVTAGPESLGPAELLASPVFAEVIRLWRSTYDLIIIDSAPILPVTDSILMSKYADQTLMVARHRVTEADALERSCALLRSQQGNLKIGIVLNGLQDSQSDYYSQYSYPNPTSKRSPLHA